MRALLSPYELDEWSPAAVSALVLFDSVATLRPDLWTEEGGIAGSGRAMAGDHPSLASLLDRWHWTSALWRAGVLAAGSDGRSVLGEARRWAEAFRSDPRLAPLQRLTGRAWHDVGDDEMEALARDVLLRGADPSIHLPVVAAVESLAARTGGVVCRGEGAGMLGRLERRGGARELARFALPVLVGGDGSTLLMVRERLASAREPLVGALQSVLTIGRDGGRPIALLDAADGYARAFEEAFGSVPALRGSHASDGYRRTLVVVSIAGMAAMPTFGATARLASIVGGRRHDRTLAAAASALSKADAGGVMDEAADGGQELLVATVKRVSWEIRREG